MKNKETQNNIDYENKIVDALTEIREGQEMIIAGNKKIQDGKLKISYGIGEMNDEIEELKSMKKKLEKVTFSESKGNTTIDTDAGEQTGMNEQSITDESITDESTTDDNHEKKIKVLVKKTRKKKRSAESIARDFDMFGGDAPLEDDEEHYFVEEEQEPKPKGERIRTGEYEGEGGLLTRRDRNRIIIIFFIAGMFIATLRAVFEGWPMIVWPPYNYFEIHENTLLRRFIRWFVDIIICEWILDFDIDPIEDDERHGNSTLYIKRQYRGVGAKNSYR